MPGESAGFELPAGLCAGGRFSREFLLTADSIRQFAGFIGDTNPLHQTPSANARFGEIIASGAHTLSLMLAAVADHLSKLGPNVGLAASVRMRRPVRAGDRVQVEWEITDIVGNPKLKGWVVTLAGRLTRQDGIVAMTAASESLLFWPPD
jgi:acyl dehydratase